MTGTCAATIAKTVAIVAIYLGFVLAVARLASSKWHPDGGKGVDGVISDGFGNEWCQCEICHNLEVVRPGKVQCDCVVPTMSDQNGTESSAKPYNQRTKVTVTDRPDPNCPHCGGRGAVGGCGKAGCSHVHTYSFCRCVNERRVEVTDDE